MNSDLENNKNILGYLRFGKPRSESEYLQSCNVSKCKDEKQSSSHTTSSMKEDKYNLNNVKKKSQNFFPNNDQILEGHNMSRIQISVEIFSIYVYPQHQRKGIGKKLLMACLDVVKAINADLLIKNKSLSNSGVNRILHHIDNVILWVGIPNAPARKFYEKHGARTVPGSYRTSAYGWKGGMICYTWEV